MVTRGFVLGLSLMVVLLTGWMPHPVHVARLELHETKASVMVTARVFMEDFPPGTELRAVNAYFGRTLRLTDATGAMVPLTTVRIAVEGDRLVITLCGAPARSLKGGRLLVTMLHEKFDDQVNVVETHRGGRTTHFVFLAGDAAQVLP